MFSQLNQAFRMFNNTFFLKNKVTNILMYKHSWFYFSVLKLDVTKKCLNEINQVLFLNFGIVIYTMITGISLTGYSLSTNCVYIHF